MLLEAIRAIRDSKRSPPYSTDNHKKQRDDKKAKSETGKLNGNVR